MRIPKIESVQTAVEIYCRNITLGNKEISALFGGICNDKVSELKKAAREQMKEDGAPFYNGTDVSTISAYKAWGLDIDELLNRYKVAKKLIGGN